MLPDLTETIRLTSLQRFFADGRPAQITVGASIAAMTLWAASILIPGLNTSLWSIVRTILLLSVAAVLGAMLGIFPGLLMLGLPYRWIESRNGAPFCVGDEVIILSKRFPGRVTTIYAIWPTRHQVRVDLGEVHREQVTDVFSYSAVCRKR